MIEGEGVSPLKADERKVPVSRLPRGWKESGLEPRSFSLGILFPSLPHPPFNLSSSDHRIY
jgi:hypothetical protein